MQNTELYEINAVKYMQVQTEEPGPTNVDDLNIRVVFTTKKPRIQKSRRDKSRSFRGEISDINGNNIVIYLLLLYYFLREPHFPNH